MRSTMLIPGLLGLTAAMPSESPATREITDLAAVEKRVSTPYYCQLASLLLCAAMPTAYGPTINSPDTVAAFEAYAGFGQSATTAVTPAGFSASFRNLTGATSTSMYLGYDQLQSYDPAACAAKCIANSRCVAFDIYFERDPSTATNKVCCPNPASVTRIKCSLWGTQISSTTANNKGQLRDQFQVAIAGSNGYNKLAGTVGAGTSSTSQSSSLSSASKKATSSAPSSVVSNKLASSALPVVSSIASAASNKAASVNANAGSLISSTPLATISPSAILSGPTSASSANGFVSNSAITASASAVALNNEPGSPVTASIPSAAAVTTCATPVQTPEITFNLNHTTDGYETMWMYGSIDQLGDWSPDNATELSAFGTSSTTNWFVVLNMTAGTYLEYKYFQRNADWSITWPSVENREYTVPTGCQSQVVVNDYW